MKEDNIVKDKSKAFAIRIIKLYQYISETKKECVLSKQVLRSGTSIGANIAESECAASRKDFINKLYIALKECNETLYWLDLLMETNYLMDNEYKSIYNDCLEIKKLLMSIVKTSGLKN